MSNHLYANYLVTDMEEVSPHGRHLVLFSVSIVFADNRYTVTARRDDCNTLYEKKVEKYSQSDITLAVYSALRKCCGYGSRYWSVSVFVDVARNIRAQLLPYLPEC